MTTFLVVYLITITLLFGQSRIMRFFNLVDKRNLIGNRETFERMNTLMERGKFSLYTFSDGKVSASVSFEPTEHSKVSLDSGFNRNLEDAINYLYDTSVKEGFIKE